MSDILLAGVGGQGTVLASKIIARCAIQHGEKAHTAETIGMAQRGGCVVSHVRTGDNKFSPLIPKGHADVIIGFEPSEAVRALPYLKKDGVVVVSSTAIKPVTDSLSKTEYNADEMIDALKSYNCKLIVVDGKKIIEECGSSKSLNVALLGAAAASDCIGITIAELKEVITSSLPKKFYETNIKALLLGEKSV